MIYTDCNNCCFRHENRDSQVCGIGQFWQNDTINTPGYCRGFRSFAWAAKTGLKSKTELCEKAAEETLARFKLTLLVLFHEDIADKDHLQHTMNATWFGHFIDKIIIADTTAPSKRTNITLEYFSNLRNNKTLNGIPVSLDVPTREELPSESPKTIYRLARKIQSPFFIAIEAGRRIANINIMAEHIVSLPTRAIYWHFPTMMGRTLIAFTSSDKGLYITKPYKELAINDGKTFAQQLREDQEIAGGISLSWLCDKCWMI